MKSPCLSLVVILAVIYTVGSDPSPHSSGCGSRSMQRSWSGRYYSGGSCRSTSKRRGSVSSSSSTSRSGFSSGSMCTSGSGSRSSYSSGSKPKWSGTLFRSSSGSGSKSSLGSPSRSRSSSSSRSYSSSTSGSRSCSGSRSSSSSRSISGSRCSSSRAPSCKPDTKPETQTRSTRVPSPPPPCRNGYTGVGSRCYKLVTEKMDWHRAAVHCGADGAALARFDTQSDEALKTFVEQIRENFLNLQASNRIIDCCPGDPCDLPEGKVGLSVRVKDQSKTKCCEGKIVLIQDGRQLVVKEGCTARSFIVETAELKDVLSQEEKIACWIGGNSRVLAKGQNDMKEPLQVDPPKHKDVGECNTGCYQVALTADGKFKVTASENCEQKVSSICDYDNSGKDNYDPLDLLLVKKKLNAREALEHCNNLNRPVASIFNKEQQVKVAQLAKDCGTNVMISAKFSKGANKFLWQDNTNLEYSNWEALVPKEYISGKERFCARVKSSSGKWITTDCNLKTFFVCGPREAKGPVRFTNFYDVEGFSCARELKHELRLQESKNYHTVCDEPMVVQCRAKPRSSESCYETRQQTSYITDSNQEKDTLVCNTNEISCKSGQELNCSTVEAKFGCPNDKNHCEILDKLGASPCTGGRECQPVKGHYVCRCPPNYIFNEREQKCIKFCGVCSAWGDPHYSTLAGKKYDFMGTCGYKFTGVCNGKEFGNKPYFNVNTFNDKCNQQARPDGTCVKAVEVKLRNIPVTTPCGEMERKDFTFTVTAYRDYYEVNKCKVTEELTQVRDVYKAIVRKNYFSLTVFAIDLKVFLQGNRLQVFVPDEFRGKLCGLCGDCDTDTFRLRNGTEVDLTNPLGGSTYDTNAIKPVALDWMLYSSRNDKSRKCGVKDVPDTCTKQQQDRVKGDKLCGIFLDKSSPLEKCFEIIKLDRYHYYWSCVFDLCETENPSQAVCGVLAAFAQICTARGVPISWRKPDFCPLKCGADMVYRVDSSCQRTCGEDPDKQGECDEVPTEGCVCKDGLFRKGDKCVPQCECGCRVLDQHGNFLKHVMPGKSVILPGCREDAICETTIDGKLEIRYIDHVMPPNSVCSNTVPPTLECSNGYQRAEDGVTCKRIEGCMEGYKDRKEMCIQLHTCKHTWSDAVDLCKESDGVLPIVDTAERIKALQEMLRDQAWGDIFISGRVLAVNHFGFVTFEQIPNGSTQTSPERANRRFYDPFLEKISLDSSVQSSEVPKEGLELNVVIRLEKGRAVFRAVPMDYQANFVCEQQY